MSSEQDFKCIFCSEIFSQKEELQIHFRKHGDPNFNHKKPRSRSQEDGDMSQEKAKSQAEVVECDVCPEVFTSISKAITHKHKMHPDHDTKYFCPWCGKLFTMKHLYNKHMQASHSDMEKTGDKQFHCDSCDVDFHVPNAMIYHNKFYHRQDELPALGQSKKLKMVTEEIVNLYYCPFCGEEYDNKVNLNKHMNEDHNGEDQSPDDVSRCPLCDAIFFYLDAYELHLTYHSIEDVYTERNDMMNEITDFSLETVQPLQEKVENADALPGDESKALGIEALLEFTMDDAPSNRKSKKHKKHKKSKKSAITLDEFLSMNTDVFGEGIDFEGIEEVPTQAVAKRFKTKKAVSASKMMSSDLAKLKKQGIVVKKQTNKPLNAFTINKGASNSTANMQKSMPKTKSNILTSTDDVLSKLLNQGSQIKIVKKSNQDTDMNEKNVPEDKTSTKSTATNNEENNHNDSEVTQTKEQNTPTNNGNKDLTLKINSNRSPTAEKPTIEGNNTPKPIQNSNDDSIDTTKYDDHDQDSPDNPKNTLNLAENIKASHNNTNVAITSSKPAPVNQESDDNRARIKDPDTGEETKAPVVSEKSSYNALKRLSNLITVKPVNSNQSTPTPEDNKPESVSPNFDTTNLAPDNSKSSCSNNLANLKNLSGLTVKSTTQSNLCIAKQSQLKMDDSNKYADENDTDDEWDDDKNNDNTTNLDKKAHILKSPQLSIQTKYSPIVKQKDSPKITAQNDNSQSSADLLRHLKNVTAKPLTANSHTTPTPKSSPTSIKKSPMAKTLVQKEVTEDGVEIFSIDDSDSDDANSNKPANNCTMKTDNKISTNKSNEVLKNLNKNTLIKSTSKVIKKEGEFQLNKALDQEDEDWSDDIEQETRINYLDAKISSPKPNQKNNAINNVLKNLGKNITVKSRNSSPSQSVQAQDHNSRDSQMETNDADSDFDSPPGRVKITEMENTDDEFSEEPLENEPHGKVKIQHPDDSHSEHEEDPIDEDFDDMSDFESQIAVAKVPKNIPPNTNNLKNLTIKSPNTKITANCKPETPQQSEEIPQYAKNLSNQISIKHIKKPESLINKKAVDQMATQPLNQSVNSSKSSTSNQVNTFNKEVKTVKTFQTQTKTVIQEITTTVTKTIKTVNQTQKQEVRSMAQSSSAPMFPQKVQGMNSNFPNKNFQGVKVRQSVPSIRPKIRGQAPQTIRPTISTPQIPRLSICAPPQVARPTISEPVRSSNQIVPMRPRLNRPTGPRPRLPHAVNMRPSVSGQQRPQIGKTVKVSPSAVFSSPKRPAETPGHFSCFKKPKESLIPEADFQLKSDAESAVQFSSTIQMSKSNFSCTTKTVKGNSVVSNSQTKSEMSASSQQLSKLRNVSGLSVVQTCQSQAKQTHVEENSEMSASQRNTLEAIQKLQNQGLLVKKPRLEVSEDSDHSQTGSDMGPDSNEEFG